MVSTKATFRAKLAALSLVTDGGWADFTNLDPKGPPFGVSLSEEQVRAFAPYIGKPVIVTVEPVETH